MGITRNAVGTRTAGECSDLDAEKIPCNRTRTIYLYSNTALRLLGQTSNLVLFSFYPSMFWELSGNFKIYNFDRKASEPC